MKCKDPLCGDGRIELSKEIILVTGVAFPCSVCGRLHHLQGDEVHKTAVLAFSQNEKKPLYWHSGAVWIDKPANLV